MVPAPGINCIIMNETIIAATLPAVITGAVALVGTLLSHRAAVSEVTKDLELRLAVMAAEMAQMKDDLKEHNHYARLFAETMPVAQEQIRSIDRRVGLLEKEDDG